ncbi:MAG: MBOAT family protein [Coriobacteriia bacterium]|nr:MBOAT family protein [Coriobacteriia bacterium]
MSLTSFGFFLFFAVVFGVYWATRRNTVRKWLLLAASYVLYASIDWRFCALLLGLSLIGLAGINRLSKEAMRWHRSLVLGIGLALSLVALVVLKYFDFFAAGVAGMLGRFGLAADDVTLGLVLPIGLSFYVFRVMSSLIDSYRGDLPAVCSPLDYLVYVAFFPQLLSGPIDRAGNLIPQIHTSRSFDYALATEGTRQVLWGLFKKLALADGIATHVDSLLSPDAGHAGPVLVVGVVLYSIQIYCDFSGYTDISIGVTKLLGIRPMRNFAYPYFSQNVAEFWRRWHISMSSWFRDYVYIPLGGSRVGRPRLFVNILITFVLSGLWHGAGLNFLAWGALLGLGVAFTSLRKKPVLGALDTPGGERLTIRAFAKMIVTFAFISLSWVFFRAESVSEAARTIGRIFTPALQAAQWREALQSIADLDVLVVLLIIFIFFEWFHRRRESTLDLRISYLPVRWLIYTCVLWLTIVMFKVNESGMFIYFQF